MKVIRVIDMKKFGLNTLVKTNQAFIDECLDDFTKLPDKLFLKGRGKKAMAEFLGIQISLEDDFFNEDIHYPAEYPDRWQNFMDDCVIYACLSSFLSSDPIPFIEDSPHWAKIDALMKDSRNPFELQHLDDEAKRTTH